MPLNSKNKNFTIFEFNSYILRVVHKDYFENLEMNSKFNYIILVFALFNANFSIAQTVSKNTTIISSPGKTIASSAQVGSNTLKVLNTYEFNWASSINLSWVSMAVGLAVASVWDNERGGVDGSSTTSSTTN